jgi:hypothetical protein
VDPIVEKSDASFISDDCDQCIRWYGMSEMVSHSDCIKHQGYEHPIIDLDSETPGLKRRFSVTRLLVVLFGDEESVRLCLRLPRNKPVPMKCGRGMCINMRHIATENLYLPVEQRNLGFYGRDTQTKMIRRLKKLQDEEDDADFWPLSVCWYGGSEQSELTSESGLLESSSGSRSSSSEIANS